MIDSVLLIGCGRMGGGLLRGWLDRKVVGAITVVEPAVAALPPDVKVFADLASVPSPLPQTIIVAVKPQMLDAVLPGLKERLPAAPLVVSIAAGKTLDYFADRLGATVPVVRAMPNTPAAIGRGIAVCCAGRTVDSAGRATAETLLAAGGEVAWVEDEELMHAVTAVSGSGPAYVFLLIEALAEAGIAAGLPKDMAERLALATVAGAGELARQSTDIPAKLRADVTSPAGTTAAALQVLMDKDGLTALMAKAVAAAVARSKELAR